MVDLSPAEIMLDSLVPAQRLIRRLQAVIAAPVPYTGIDLPRRTKDKIAAFQGDYRPDSHRIALWADRFGM